MISSYGRQGVLTTSVYGKTQQTLAVVWVNGLCSSEQSCMHLDEWQWWQAPADVVLETACKFMGQSFQLRSHHGKHLPNVDLIKHSPWVEARITLKRGYPWDRDEGELNLFLCLMKWTHWIQCTSIKHKNKRFSWSYCSSVYTTGRNDYCMCYLTITP